MSDSSGESLATQAAASQAGEPLPLSQLLRQIVDDHPAERFSLSELAGLLRDRMWGGLLLIFAGIHILPLPPGTTTVTGIPLMILTAQMAAHRKSPWFPRRFDRRGVTRDELTRLADKLSHWERRLQRLLKPRIVALTSRRATRVIGAISFLLSVVLWLPIPLGNHAPAIAMTLFAAALIYRDGVLVLLGAAATLVSVALLTITFGAVWLAFMLAAKNLFG